MSNTPLPPRDAVSASVNGSADAWFARSMHAHAAAVSAAKDARIKVLEDALAKERERWMEVVMAELDGNGQAQAIVAYATKDCAALGDKNG